MTKIQYERLEPFLKWKTARQRLILFLLAESYTVKQIVNMTKSELKRVEFCTPLEAYLEELLDDIGTKQGKAFFYPSGSLFQKEDIYRILRQTTQRFYGRALKVAEFRDYIQQGINIKEGEAIWE